MSQHTSRSKGCCRRPLEAVDRPKSQQSRQGVQRGPPFLQKAGVGEIVGVQAVAVVALDPCGQVRLPRVRKENGGIDGGGRAGGTGPACGRGLAGLRGGREDAGGGARAISCGRERA